MARNKKNKANGADGNTFYFPGQKANVDTMERNEVQADMEDEDNFIEFNAGADTSPKPSTVPGITIPEIVTPEPIAGDPDAGILKFSNCVSICSIGCVTLPSLAICHQGRYLNDVRKFFGFLDPLPPLVTVPITQPISTIITF